MKKKNIKEFYQTKKEEFTLTQVTNPKTLDNAIVNKYLNRPGLALGGFFDSFAYERIQILCET